MRPLLFQDKALNAFGILGDVSKFLPTYIPHEMKALILRGCVSGCVCGIGRSLSVVNLCVFTCKCVRVNECMCVVRYDRVIFCRQIFPCSKS